MTPEARSKPFSPLDALVLDDGGLSPPEVARRAGVDTLGSTRPTGRGIVMP